MAHLDSRVLVRKPHYIVEKITVRIVVLIVIVIVAVAAIVAAVEQQQ